MADRKAYFRERRRRLSLPPEEREKHPVRIFRKQYGLSLRQLGRILGVSYATIGYWESGEIRTPAWVTETIEEQDEYLLRAIEKEKRHEKGNTQSHPGQAYTLDS